MENLSIPTLVKQGDWVALLNPKTVLILDLSVLPPFEVCRRGGGSVYKHDLLSVGILEPADGYSVGYCHGVIGAYSDQIHQ